MDRDAGAGFVKKRAIKRHWRRNITTSQVRQCHRVPVGRDIFHIAHLFQIVFICFLFSFFERSTRSQCLTWTTHRTDSYL